MAAPPSDRELNTLVRRVMQASGMTDTEIVSATGIDGSQISRVKWGHRGVSLDGARRILDACGYRLVITTEPIRAEVAA